MVIFLFAGVIISYCSYHLHTTKGIVSIQSFDVVINIVCNIAIGQIVLSSLECQFHNSKLHFVQIDELHYWSSRNHVCVMYQLENVMHEDDAVVHPNEPEVVPIPWLSCLHHCLCNRDNFYLHFSSCTCRKRS